MASVVKKKIRIRRTSQLNVRVGADELLVLEMLAIERCCSASAVVRQLIKAAARELRRDAPQT